MSSNWQCPEPSMCTYPECTCGPAPGAMLPPANPAPTLYTKRRCAHPLACSHPNCACPPVTDPVPIAAGWDAFHARSGYEVLVIKPAPRGAFSYTSVEHPELPCPATRNVAHLALTVAALLRRFGAWEATAEWQTARELLDRLGYDHRTGEPITPNNGDQNG